MNPSHMEMILDELRRRDEALEQRFSLICERFDDISTKQRLDSEIIRKSVNSVNVLIRLLAGFLKMSRESLLETLIESDAHVRNLVSPFLDINFDKIPVKDNAINHLKLLAEDLNKIINSCKSDMEQSSEDIIYPIDINEMSSVQNVTSYNQSSLETLATNTIHIKNDNDDYEDIPSSSQSLPVQNIIPSQQSFSPPSPEIHTKIEIIEDYNDNFVTTENVETAEVVSIGSSVRDEQKYLEDKLKDQKRRFYKNKYNYRYKNKMPPNLNNMQTSSNTLNIPLKITTNEIIPNSNHSGCRTIEKPARSFSSPRIILTKFDSNNPGLTSVFKTLPNHKRKKTRLNGKRKPEVENKKKQLKCTRSNH